MNPILYVGIDVAKTSLQLSLAGQSRQLANDKKGHRQLLQLLAKAQAAAAAETQIQVVLEASGGYEALLVAALHGAAYPLSVVQPGRVRHFAKAKNKLAKTDRIDAAMLVAFGEAIRPEPTMPPSAAQSQLTELVRRRLQLVEVRTAEINRAAHYGDQTLRQQARRLLALLDRQIDKLERLMARLIAAEAEMKQRSERLQEVKGVGAIVAATLQAELPELGSLNDGQAAALAGLAPYNRDSGPYQGTRRICGGRTAARCALYMAALTAVRYDPILRAFYRRLLGAGKKRIVALTAAMRKLVVLLNRLLKDPQFKLSY